MRRHIDGHRIANAIRMQRSARPEACFLVVEGPTDANTVEVAKKPPACGGFLLVRVAA